jgi:site-specific recombinase XerD
MPPKTPNSPLNASLKPDLTLLDHRLVKNWLANVLSPATRISRHDDLVSFITYTQIKAIDDFKAIKRADIIEWRDDLMGTKEKPRYAIRTVKRRMATISKFFEHLCDEKIIEVNVVQGVQRPKLTTTEGATSIISDHQAKDILDAPDPGTLKGKRDRAILATFLFHALRRAELCNLKVKDVQEREGIKQLRVFGKGSKERYIPVHPVAQTRIAEYLSAAGHGMEKEAALFKPISNNAAGRPLKGLSPNSVYELVLHYGEKVGIEKGNFSTHSLRATAATNALNNREDIRKVQQWLGHAAVQTTAMYDKRENRPEDSPTFRVRY